MKEHIFMLIEKIKEAFKAFWNWGKDSYFKWALKGFVIVLMAIAAILIIRELIFPLTIAALVIYSIADSSAGKRNLQNIQTQNAANALHEAVSNVICTTLIENAKLLQVAPPKMISDILPINSRWTTTQNGYDFFHYIVRCEDLNNSKLLQNRALFNELVTRTKMDMFPTDRGILHTMKIGRDLRHHDALHIVIFYVDNNAKWEYVQSYENYLRNQQQQASSDLKDEDF